MATATTDLTVSRSSYLTDGTGSGQANLEWHDSRNLAASASENLDLAGSLTDEYGQTITFAKIKCLLIAASSENTNNVLVGGAASNAFVNWVANSSDIVVVKPGGALMLIASNTGYAVTATSGDILKIANSAGSTGVDYDVVLVGTSA